ncbi:MAG: metallophosphoesterase family protein, partial [Ellagibacter isourolithinifaciens]|nr:metallophosphoesterase family protein [Ellagibacter isourolithinifaciens]
MARIGVISDTHGVLPVEAFNTLADCEHIIHAGDICSPEIICDLQTLAPVTAVLGNNDFNEYGTSVRRFARPVIDGVRFLVAHYPRDVRIVFAGSGALAPGDPLPNVCIHGHTHIPEIVVGKEA